MATEFHISSFSPEPHEEPPSQPSISEIRLRSLHETAPSIEGAERKDVSLEENVATLRDRLRTLLRVLTRRFDAAQDVSKPENVGRSFRRATLSRATDMDLSKSAIRLPKLLDALDRAEKEGFENQAALEDLLDSTENVARLLEVKLVQEGELEIKSSPMERLGVRLAEQQVGFTQAIVDQRRKIAELVKSPSTDMAARIEEIDRIENEELALREDVSVMSQLPFELVSVARQAQELHVAVLRKMQQEGRLSRAA